MPTRGNPRLVARAIRGFQLQTWPERQRMSSSMHPLLNTDVQAVF